MQTAHEVHGAARTNAVMSKVRRGRRGRAVACCALVLAWRFGVGALSAEEVSTDSENKLVTGRAGVGALTDSRYSGGAGNRTFPVPLMSLEIGDFAYVDYWEAGLFVASN